MAVREANIPIYISSSPWNLDIKDLTISLLNNNCSGRKKNQQLTTEKRRLSGRRSSLHSEPED